VKAGRVRIETIKVKDLYKVACEKHATRKPGEIVVLPKRRALSYSLNPYASDEDIGMLLAYIDDICIGFLGIMPGMLRHGDRLRKVHWLSTWYVAPEPQNTGAGALLMRRALSLQYDLMVTGTNPQADALYRRINFEELRPLKYRTLFVDMFNFPGFVFSMVCKFLERRGRRITFVRPAWLTSRKCFIYPFCKRFFYAFISIGHRRLARSVVVEEKFSLEEEAADMLEQRGKEAPVFYRGREIINWMLQYPWVSSAKQESTPGYYFADYRPLFKQILVNLRTIDSGNVVGTVLCSVSAEDELVKLTVQDFNFNRPEDLRLLMVVALRLAAKNQADRLILPEECASHLPKFSPLRLLLIRRQRTYFAHSKRTKSVLLRSVLDRLNLQLSDGDCAFT